MAKSKNVSLGLSGGAVGTSSGGAVGTLGAAGTSNRGAVGTLGAAGTSIEVRKRLVVLVRIEL